MAHEHLSDSPIPPGKIPPELLARLLAGSQRNAPDVVVGPGLGEDAAVVRLGGRLVVVTCDPITFPTPKPGWYAVHVNANDIAVMGGSPEYFLLSIMLPPGSTGRQVSECVGQAVDALDSLGAVLIGGHTEVTEAVNTPVVSGTMFGGLLVPEPLSTGRGRAGDAVIQVNPMAVEGTSILAGEHRDTLVEALGELTVARAEGFLTDPGLSVVAPARLAASRLRVHAMHDPTEGGIATGLREIAQASGTGLVVEERALILAPETEKVCRALAYDPLGLISSGCLLFTVPAAEAEEAVRLLRSEDYPAAQVGSLTADAGTYELVGADSTVGALPEFAVDQLAGQG